MADRHDKREYIALLRSSDRPLTTLFQEKEEQERQMKLSLEVYIHGVKDGNRIGK